VYDLASNFTQFQLHVQGGGTVLNDIHTRALRCAAERVGGDEKLRLHLGASEGDFSTWTAQPELPRSVFLRLVDIITGEETRGDRRAWR
jgi:hypothetical protein